jgi:hypothetical protein
MLRRSAIITMCFALGLLVAEPIFFANAALAQPSDSSPADYVPRDMTDLEQLTAPVALYPDAILAQVLVACSYPDDVISAAQWLSAGNDPQGIDDQDWDLSVKGVARYPSALNYMASHADWMNDLGDAFVNQESDVMTSVQLLRAQANAAGNLVSNDQQQVVIDGDVVEIIPADPQVIYVPQYDPQVVYVERRLLVGERWEPLVTFGVGIRVGDWLRHDCDWDDHAVYVGDWGRDRPWWHRDDHRDGEPAHRYADYRPGTYRSTNITNIRNTTVINNRTEVRNTVTNVAQNGRWQRDSRKPAPRPASMTVNRAPNPRSGTGYPPARPAAERIASEPSPPSNVAVPQDARGAVSARASSRGQRSRQTTAQAMPKPVGRPAPAPAAARPAPAPVAARPAAPAQPAARPEPAPRAAKPARAAPAPRPAPAARPAPTLPAARPNAPTRGGAMGSYQNGSEAARSSDRSAKSRGSSQPKDHR